MRDMLCWCMWIARGFKCNDNKSARQHKRKNLVFQGEEETVADGGAATHPRDHVTRIKVPICYSLYSVTSGLCLNRGNKKGATVMQNCKNASQAKTLVNHKKKKNMCSTCLRASLAHLAFILKSAPLLRGT